jgi:lysophospholipase L1-like esterase
VKPPHNSPKKFLKKNRTKPVVMMIGDSITHGRIGTNFVNILSEKFDNYEFVNAGINGHHVWNVNQRLDEIIACQADHTFILIGTNDANATLSEKDSNNYVKRYKLPQKPDIEWYRDNLTSLISRIQKETPSKIGILSLPTIGEEIGSEELEHGMRYSEIIKEVSSQLNCDYLPLNETMQEKLKTKNTKNPFTHDKNDTQMVKAIFNHYAMRKSWNKIAENSGLRFHIDYLHLNDAGADLIVQLVTDKLL